MSRMRIRSRALLAWRRSFSRIALTAGSTSSSSSADEQYRRGRFEPLPDAPCWLCCVASIELVGFVSGPSTTPPMAPLIDDVDAPPPELADAADIADVAAAAAASFRFFDDFVVVPGALDVAVDVRSIFICVTAD